MTTKILIGDCRDTLLSLPEQSVQMCVTSPPYFGLRDYGVDGQIGLEQTPDAFVSELVSVFREVRRVLRENGTLWLNLGDSYCSIGHKKSGSGYGTTGLAGGVAQEHHPLRRENNVPGLKHKDLIGIPWRVAFALQADGWYLRSDIIWHKPNPMPESVTDRPTKSHEYLFLLTKSERYYYDAAAIAEGATFDKRMVDGFVPKSVNGKHPTTDSQSAANRRANDDVGNADAKLGNAPHSNTKKQDALGKRTYTGFNDRWSLNPTLTRNKRTVWTVPTSPYKGAHFATFPTALIEPCIKAGSKQGDTVLDTFGGAGTTGLVADRLGRNAILCELNPEYVALAESRVRSDNPMFSKVEVSR